MQKKNLKAELDELSVLSINGDPRVQKATKMVDDLERKRAETLARVEEKKTALSKQEEAAAEGLLAGGSASVGAINKIRAEISDLGSEEKILTLAIERARQAEEDVRKSVRVELRKRALELFVAAQSNFNESFRKSVEEHGSLLKAHGIAYGLGLTYSLGRLSLDRQLFELEKDLAGYKRDLDSESWKEN